MAGVNGGNTKRLIINYLPQCMVDQELYTIFASVGPLESCRIMRDSSSGYSFGFGFVSYLNSNDADRAIQNLNGFQVKQKRLKVSYARPPGEELKNTNLYIQNLPRTYDEDAVEEMFSKYGTIVQKSVLTDKISGMPRGVAFVRYNKKDEADAAIEALNGQQMEGALLPLSIKIAEEHGKSKAAYFAGLTKGMNHFQYRGGMGGPRAMMGGVGGGAGAGGYRPPRPMRPQFRPPVQMRGRGRFNPIARGGVAPRGRGAAAGGPGFYQQRSDFYESSSYQDDDNFYAYDY